MTPIELLNIIDSGMVEELTMYYYGHKTVFKILDMLKDYQKLSAFNCPIARIWNSESGNGISVLLADKLYSPKIVDEDKTYSEENYTSISTGYAQFTAEDKGTCDNCKHNRGLPSRNGSTEYSGACIKCHAKSHWESNK